MRNSRVVLSLLIALSLVFLYYAPSFAATIITDWNTAKTQYPGSTDGNLGNAAGGIVWSRHNLSSYGWPFQAVKVGPLPDFPFIGTSVATTEICVFCHTPHFAKTDTAPLWNRGSSATAYIGYGTNGSNAGGTGGTTLAGTATAVGGSSLACLSCHDGVTTFDNLINKPGKGSNTNGTGDDQGWWFYMASASGIPVVHDRFKVSVSPTDNCSSCHDQSESDRLNIGIGPGSTNPFISKVADLSNDHPINVAYNGDDTTDLDGPRASLRAKTTVISSISILNARSNGDDTNRDIYGRSDNLWAVKGFITNTATIEDLLRDGGKVQCTTCHDPHYKNQTNNDPAVVDSYDRTGSSYPGYNRDVSSASDPLIDGLFLRRVGGNSNSGLCRTCHNK